jgi:predicted MFS family arabinose efflux permease
MRPVSVSAVIFLIGAIQAVNVLDFMMVMPMGPWFAEGLGFPLSHVAWLGGSYTAAAAVSGFIGAYFLDRFDRRKALAVALVGLVLGTAAGGFAVDLGTLLAARMIAGAFGGPATSLALSVIADVVPPERRGRAVGAVMSAFSVASVFGVPAGLKLAQLGGWRLPFFAVAGLAAVVAIGAVLLLPPMRGHIAAARAHPPRRGRFAGDPLARLSLVTTATIFAANFSVIPNIAGFLQANLGYPADRMDVLYGVGGAFSFVTMSLVGRAVDRVGAPAVATVGAALYVGVMSTVFIWAPPGLPILPLFVTFMVAQSLRMVPLNALTSRVPTPADRAGFMSTQSAVQHIASSIGAFLSAGFLFEAPDGRLVGMDRVATIATALCLLPPALMFLIQRGVLAREGGARSRPGPPPSASTPPAQ